jgi:hypothetical protein
MDRQKLLKKILFGKLKGAGVANTAAYLRLLAVFL